jgi:hypothetical protein
MPTEQEEMERYFDQMARDLMHSESQRIRSLEEVMRGMGRMHDEYEYPQASPSVPVPHRVVEPEITGIPLHDIAGKIALSGDFDTGRTGHITCNLLVDRILSEGSGIQLPRIRDELSQFPPGSDEAKQAADWKDNPMRVRQLHKYLPERSKISDSGMYKVSASEGVKLSKQGYPVVAISGTHVGLMAPTDWPSIYSEHISRHQQSGKAYVGIMDPDRSFEYYHIDPKQYNQFNKQLESAGFTHEDVYASSGFDETGRHTSRSGYEDLRQFLQIKDLIQ